MKKKIILKSNIYKNTKLDDIGVALIGTPCLLNSGDNKSDNYILIGNTKHFPSCEFEYLECKINDDFSIYDLVGYEKDGKFFKDVISWTVSIDGKLFAKMFYRNEYVEVNNLHRLVSVSSIDNLVGMVNSDGSKEIIGVNWDKKFILIYSVGTDMATKLIWYADGGLARFWNRLIEFGFMVKYRNDDCICEKKIKNIIKYCDDNNLIISETGKHINFWLIENSKDVIKVKYNLVDYLMINYNINIDIGG